MPSRRAGGMRGRSGGRLTCGAQLGLEEDFPSETGFRYTQVRMERLAWMRLRQTPNSCSRRVPATSPHRDVHTCGHTPRSSPPAETLVKHHPQTRGAPQFPGSLPFLPLSQSLDQPEPSHLRPDPGSLLFLPSHIISCFELSPTGIQPSRPEQGKNSSCQKPNVRLGGINNVSCLDRRQCSETALVRLHFAQPESHAKSLGKLGLGQ